MSVITSIMASFMIWIASVTGIPVPDTMPTLERASLVEMYCAVYELEGENCPKELDTDTLLPVATYAPKTGVITVWSKMELRSTRGYMTLVHELVHHMQTEAGLKYECRGALEKVAYDTVLKWLGTQGYDPWVEYERLTGTDKFTYLLITSCFQDM